MAREIRTEIREVDAWRAGALLAGGRLALGLSSVVFSYLGLSSDEISVSQELVIGPISFLISGLAIIVIYNSLAQLFGGVRLRLSEYEALVLVGAPSTEPEPTIVEWSYFDEDERPRGPYEDQAFRALIQDGVVGPDTKVSRAVRNLVSELVLEDRTRPARDHPELTARLRSAAESGAERQGQDAAEP